MLTEETKKELHRLFQENGPIWAKNEINGDLTPIQ